MLIYRHEALRLCKKSRYKLLRQLNRRLGQVSKAVSAQIRQLPVEQLEDLGEALLDFENEADLLNWLAKY